MSLNKFHFTILCVLMLMSHGIISGNNFDQPLSTPSLVPVPKKIIVKDGQFNFGSSVTIIIDGNHSGADEFAAGELAADLKKEFGINAVVSSKKSENSIVLSRSKSGKSIPPQGYTLNSRVKEINISSGSEEGLFYGTQTLLQLIEKTGTGYSIPAVEITDWPDTRKRAAHYDTKHHQDKAEYVRSFIRDLARYKINMLVWEWEDKFEYPSHQEIGAPGAFTMKEMQEFTRYARRYHIQIVPLVQGLGHVSFILKWPQHKHLREVESSNWQFCPLKDGTYELLFDLWEDAIEATPGSEYIHIGSDETYELGLCEKCSGKAEELGKSGLYTLFINRSAEFLKKKGRKVMAWERPMGWTTGKSPAKGIEPLKGLVLSESYSYETPGFSYARKAKDEGYEIFSYDPNPGVVPLMVPYFFESDRNGIKKGSLERSYDFLSDAASEGLFDGMISTSWDDDGLHNQMWLMHFVNAAAWAWNAAGGDLNSFRKSWFSSYYGPEAKNLDELYELLNAGAYYFAGTMERNVWHHGQIGQTHLPDLPRGDAIEYDPYWNMEYKEKVSQSAEMLEKMNRALDIISENKKAGIKHEYDLDVLRTCAELIRHTCLTYRDLSNLEYAIREAHVNRFINMHKSVEALEKAQSIIENSLKRRKDVFGDLVLTWEVTRLPKGYSTPEKQFFWQQDRARHFAFRTPGMSYLIYDEQLLDLEGYLEKLKKYTEYFSRIE